MQWLMHPGIFFLTISLTGLIVRFAWNFGLLDHPDSRRSHLHITPRGGGLAIVLGFWGWLVWSIFYTHFPSSLILPLLPALLFALLGLMDDFWSLSAKIRLVLQFFLAGLSLYWMGGIHFILTIKGLVIPAPLVWIACLFLIVWSVNLYNFMDGINGLAGFEALTVSCFMAFITYWDGDLHKSALWSVLASAVAGFLIWNFPKARIFLGDVGSYFLGSMFGILLMQSANTKPRWFWCGMILLGFFVVDATLTLLVRIWFRQPVFKAHTTHAFQIILKKFASSHTVVTGIVFAINLFWLMPWAMLVSKSYVPGFIAMLLAYLPLVIIVWLVEAGKPDVIA